MKEKIDALVIIGMIVGILWAIWRILFTNRYVVEFKAEDFEEVKVCPHCGAPSEEKFSGDEGWSFCSDGCGSIEGEKSVYKFECPSCHELKDEPKCNCK